MNIRFAQPRNIPRLGELLEQVCRVHWEGRPDLFRAGGRKYDDGELRELLQDSARPILVAERDGLVVGYAFCAYQVHRGEGAFNDMTTLYLDDLCVDEACRGNHVGGRLYRAVLELARSAGCYNVTLNVWSCNGDALRFYEKCGLKPQKIGMETIL